MKSALSPALVWLQVIPLIAATGTIHMGITGKRNPEGRPLRRRDNTVLAPLGEPQDASGYTANITIGTPPQEFQIQIDTGSGDLWVVANDAQLDLSEANDSSGLPPTIFDYGKSSTYKDLDEPFQDGYVDGTSVNGTYFTDNLGIGGITLEGMQMGLAKYSTENQGIMGISFSSEESAYPNNTFPNLVDQMVNQSHIATHAYSLWLNDQDAHSGSLLFGGIDTGKFVGDLATINMYPYALGSDFASFIVAFTSLSISTKTGNTTLTPSDYSQPVVLDSGTTDTIIPDDLARAIYDITGASWSSDAGEPFVPCEMANIEGTFDFGFGGPSGPVIKVPISEMLSPIIVNGSDPLPAGICGFNFIPLASTSPSTTILFGDSFLRSAYVVYDLDNLRVGMAQTVFNSTESNIVAFESLAAAIPSGSSVSEPEYSFSTSLSGNGPTGVTTSFVAPTTSFSGSAGAAFATLSAAYASLGSAATSSVAGVNPVTTTQGPKHTTSHASKTTSGTSPSGTSSAASGTPSTHANAAGMLKVKPSFIAMIGLVGGAVLMA